MSMHIGHVALRVPDIQSAASYAERALGLCRTTESPSEVFLSSNEKHHELQLIADERPRFAHIGLEVESEAELEEVAERALAAGAQAVDVDGPHPGLSRPLRLVGPAGIEYEIYAEMERRPLAISAHLKPMIRRLGHLTFLSDNPEAILDFWLGGLGFRTSDSFEGMTWTRCDADHHGLAIGSRAEGTVLHHHAWEVQDWGALGAHCDHLGLEDIELYWGPVRHGPGFNLATYFPEPAGGVIEVYADMLKIDDESAYRPIDWSQEPKALNLWGPQPAQALLDAAVPVE